jgi:hypothetical protein
MLDVVPVYWKEYSRLQDDLDNEDDDLVVAVVGLKRIRSVSTYRQRWQEVYLRDLAIRENSFATEYRMDPASFDIIVQMLEQALEVDSVMAGIAMSRCASKPITVASRVAQCLIKLGGGRMLEVMRTHGVSKSAAYSTFRSVIKAINACPSLAIRFDSSIEGL